MKTLIAILLFLFVIHCQLKVQNFTQFVNPFIGTGAVDGSSLSGNNFPGAALPFAMVQLSPDTRDEPDWSLASGYNYNDTMIYGFSHTHLSGTGVAELFDLLVMPTAGEPRINSGMKPNVENGYRSRFDHRYEQARPGYYQVKLLDYNINAELTVTEHTGFHRYTFPRGNQANVVFDLDHSLKKPDWDCHIIASQLRIVDSVTLEGYRIITGWAKLRKVYFSVSFSSPVTQTNMADGDRLYKGVHVLNGSDLRAVFSFDKLSQNKQLLIKVGLSAVSIENARENLNAEIPGWDFDAIVMQADQIWEKELSKIRVEGDLQQKTIFYTALYHTMIQPNNLADINGDYMAGDYTIRKSSDGKHYSTFSLWDSYRAANPLYTLIQPDRTAGFVNSLLSQYQTIGFLPVWQLWGQENYCMIGNHSIPVIVDAVLKGIIDTNIKEIYEAVKNSSMLPHLNSPFDSWEKYGYMPEDLQSQSVSITLEMAYDDWCVAQLAKKLGKVSDYEYFMKRSQFYQNIFDAKTAFFRAKDSKGNWLSPFDPLQYGANGGHPFTEGNAWQYFWYVPHDVEGLIDLCGGKKAFAQKLDTFFTLDNTPEHINDNASGFIGQYAHGNEPSHHVTYLYDYAGEPWKTQFYVSKIVNELYTTTSAGYPGNEDCGQMSAWYIFSSLGFYPVNPANGIYMIGSPHWSFAEINTGKSTFSIICKNASPQNIYIQRAKLNEVTLNRSYITHEEITKGGKLEFEMGSRPNYKWGK